MTDSTPATAATDDDVLVPCRWCGRDWFSHEHPEKGNDDAIC